MKKRGRANSDGPTDGQTDGPTKRLIELRARNLTRQAPRNQQRTDQQSGGDFHA